MDLSPIGECEQKHEMMLDLSFSGQKSGGIFGGADQTPTPTCLIKNCEEVGLFEDLRHVNPFEETFRRAVEQKTTGQGQTPSQAPESVEQQNGEDSLHTPQVFPQLDNGADGCFRGCSILSKSVDCLSSVVETLDVPVVEDLLTEVNAYKSTSRQNSNSSSANSGRSQKCALTAEKVVLTTVTATGTTASVNSSRLTIMQLPTAIQLIQPQVITLTFPDSNAANTNDGRKHMAVSGVSSGSDTYNAIPVQSVKPFLMPKPMAMPTPTPTIAKPSGVAAAVGAAPILCLQSQPTNVSPSLEPSSASLTPTSQLPIKERLKAILNSGGKSHDVAPPQNPKGNSPNFPYATSTKPHQYDEKCLERRRAAATRYRNKMRNEHKELRRRNMDLQSENERLRERVKCLEQELTKQQQQPFDNEVGNTLAAPASTPQIHIPPSTVHLVMNIPKLIVPSNGQAPVLQAPITYRMEKK